MYIARTFFISTFSTIVSISHEIPQFKNLSWPSEAIKILFAYFNHLIKAKSSLDLNMRIIQNFDSWG
jgi:hypothetical protein